MPTPGLRRAFSTSAISPCARPRSTCGDAASRFAYEGMARRGAVGRAGPDPGGDPGLRLREGADPRVGEPGRAEKACRGRRSRVLPRSRGKLWRKGEESGHVQKVREVRLECDA